MVSVTSASHYITSASRYHSRYQSRSSMYIRGLIPGNFTELADAVPIGLKSSLCDKCQNINTVKKIVIEYDQEISQTADVRKRHTTITMITRHKEDKQSKATSSLFSIEMIAKLELTQRNAHQNTEQLQTPTMGITINN